MGMAASQSRFLSLTARKSNTEYQGQQVNQQRTVLANQTANLYNQMMQMEVPTPPSVESFYNKVYSFTNSADSSDKTVYKIVDFSQVNEEVKISYDKTISAMSTTGAKLNCTKVNTDTNGTTTSKEFQVGTSDAVVKTCKPDDETKNAIINKYNTASGQEKGYWAAFVKKDGTYNDAATLYSVTYGKDSTDQYYISEDAYQNSKADDQLTLWKIGEATQSKTAKLSVANSGFTYNDIGRLTSIQLKSENSDLGFSKDCVFNLDFSKIKDDEAYEEAMLDYKYKQAQYDKEYERINNETKTLQLKDKNLELKLKQLDTEQNAIQTEMEAVTKVIDKNIEDTFKTFA